MKKLIVVLAVVLVLGGCTYKNTTPDDIGIPQRTVTHIEFWNGGTMIREFDNPREILTKMDHRSNWGTDISFYRYEVTTADGKIITIVDSESLAIVYY